MVKFFTIILFSISFLFCQDLKNIENPCKSELIIKAKKEGMRSIKPAELPKYLKDVWNCRKETAGKKTLQKINQRTNEIDQNNSSNFQGFTVTCAYCASASVLIFYIFKLSGN